MPSRRYRISMPTNPRQNARKYTKENIGSSWKRPKKETFATSSDFVLTNISSTDRGKGPMIDY